ncbi:hypothetical protein [Streptomyces melanogenes]|uniref:DUF7848 domain-containing protein n=1 Tax=Streptomyces melanogenes TaxID=67326 RepID=A0ABZ1XSB4_9ACTN|nr:hypothetical protein [Streptomyces melanogenes]
MRSVIRYAEWTLGADTTPGASAPIHVMECTTCLDTSPPSDTRDGPEDWAIRHTARHHDHAGFRAVVTSFGRVTPAPGNPLYEQPSPR